MLKAYKLEHLPANRIVVYLNVNELPLVEITFCGTEDLLHVKWDEPQEVRNVS